MVIIAACSSSAHQLLDLLSDRCVYVPKTRSPRNPATTSVLSGPAVRNARGNTRRRHASSKHAWRGCR